MRTILPAGAAVVALLSAASVHAQGVCTTANGPCASYPEQLVQYAEQAAQLVQESQTALEEVTNTLKLGATAFHDLTAEINTITAITQNANMLIGLSGQIVTNISSAHGYPDISNWHQQVSNEAAAVGNAMRTAATVTNRLATLANDAGNLAILVSQVMATVGRQQSLQTLQSSLSTMAQTLQRTQMTGVTNQQAMMTWAAAQQDYKYLAHTVSDHDLESTWVNECSSITDLGGTAPSSICGQ